MKPDKHKQKRTQQYKKKHGIKDEKGKESKEDKSTSPSGRGSHPHPRRPTSPTGGGAGGATDSSGFATAGTQRRDLPYSRKKNSDSDSETHVERKSFKRREVVSNWERYAGIQDEQEPIHTEQRGADFKTLISSSSSAVSQFRFEDEKSWDEDLAMLSGSQINSLLSIDTNELAAALECVPLHKKLNVNENVFRKEDIELFQQEAALNRKLYLEAREKHQPKSDPTKTPHGLSLNNDTNPVGDLGVDFDNIMSDDETVSHPENNQKNIAEKPPLNSSEQTNIEIDQDLDELLGCDGDGLINVAVSKDTKPETAASKNDQEFGDDQDLDNLLSGGVSQGAGFDSKNTTSNKVDSVSNLKIGDMNGDKTETKQNNLHDNTQTANMNSDSDTAHNVISNKDVAEKNKKNTLSDSSISTELKNKTSSGIPAPTASSLEDELDFLLSLDDQPKSVETQSNSKPELVAKLSDTGQGDDLEDWLDSVLDS